MVADLRLTTARYPADQRLKQLTRDLVERSPRLVELWECGTPEPQQDFGRRKVNDHPAVGRMTLECDTLIVAADDLVGEPHDAVPARTGCREAPDEGDRGDG